MFFAIPHHTTPHRLKCQSRKPKLFFSFFFLPKENINSLLKWKNESIENRIKVPIIRSSRIFLNRRRKKKKKTNTSEHNKNSAYWKNIYFFYRIENWEPSSECKGSHVFRMFKNAQQIRILLIFCRHFWFMGVRIAVVLSLCSSSNRYEYVISYIVSKVLCSLFLRFFFFSFLRCFTLVWTWTWTYSRWADSDLLSYLLLLSYFSAKELHSTHAHTHTHKESHGHRRFNKKEDIRTHF